MKQQNQKTKFYAVIRDSWLYRILFLISLLICSYFLFRQQPIPEWFTDSDKWGHTGGFFILVLFGYLAVSRFNFVLLLAGLLLLAMGSEWIQGSWLLPLRHGGDIGDLKADLIGYVLRAYTKSLFQLASFKYGISYQEEDIVSLA